MTKAISLIALLIVLLGLGFLSWRFLYPDAGDSTQFSILGVIRTGGVSPEDQARWQLSSIPEYQITDFAPIDQTDLSVPYGYFLTDIPAKLGLGSYVGTCVLLQGNIEPSWSRLELRDTYGRSALHPTKLVIKPLSECANAYTYPHYELTDPTQFPPRTFTGLLTRANRPAPDINYDYQLTFDQPVSDISDSSGTGIPPAAISVVPTSPTIWADVERLVNSSVTIVGPVAWGYAESQVLLITSVVAQ